MSDVEHVDCGSCSACCRKECVALVEGDNLNDYPEAVEFTLEGKAYLRSLLPGSLGWVLPHNADGACVYLRDGACSIYEKRPAMCRRFSCVGFVKRIMETTTRAERRRDRHLIDGEIWQAGKKRIEASP